jgi:hypothetical protein
MILLGTEFRFWAVASLRSFFSYTVQIKEGHHVVETGPYRFVRHPAYAGSLLTIVGVGFALQSWGQSSRRGHLLGGLRLPHAGGGEALVDSLGEEYLVHERVKRIIPFVLRRGSQIFR